MHEVVTTFHSSILAYRHFYEYVVGALGNLEIAEQPEAKAFSDLRRVASESDLKNLNRFARFITENVRADGEGAVGSKTGNTKKETKFTLRLTHDAVTKFMKAVNLMTWSVPPSKHKELLFRGILTGLVGQFEVLISDIATAFFGRATGALDTKDKTLSVSDIRQFASLKELEEFIVANRVNDLLRGSLDDWAEFLLTRMKISLQQLAPDWPRFKEHIQRRHIIVHAGGRLSRRYLSSVGKDLAKELCGTDKIGDSATLSADYIQKALSAFEITGLCLGFNAWIRLYPDERSMLESLVSRFLRGHMRLSHFETAHHLASWTVGEESLSPAIRTDCQLMEWLALKRSAKWDTIADDVRKFDTSALHPRFAIAKAALLGDLDECLKIFRRTRGANVTRHDWDDWPLLEDLQKDKRFERLVKTGTRRKRDSVAKTTIRNGKNGGDRTR